MQDYMTYLDSFFPPDKVAKEYQANLFLRETISLQSEHYILTIGCIPISFCYCELINHTISGKKLEHLP